MDRSESQQECCGPQHSAELFSPFPWDGNRQCTREEVTTYATQQAADLVNRESNLCVIYWRLGTALNLLRRQVPYGEWETLLSGIGIDKTRAARARAIARSFASESDLAGLSVEEAYARRQRRNYSQTNKGRSRRLLRLLDRVPDVIEQWLENTSQEHTETDLALSASLAEARRALALLHDRLTDV